MLILQCERLNRETNTEMIMSISLQNHTLLTVDLYSWTYFLVPRWEIT